MWVTQGSQLSVGGSSRAPLKPTLAFILASAKIFFFLEQCVAFFFFFPQLANREKFNTSCTVPLVGVAVGGARRAFRNTASMMWWCRGAFPHSLAAVPFSWCCAASTKEDLCGHSPPNMTVRHIGFVTCQPPNLRQTHVYKYDGNTCPELPLPSPRTR